MQLHPSKDGTSHINVYSKGKTELGRWLSNFSRTPIQTEDGKFESIEGYWYWLSTNHESRDELRRLSGWQAKALGRELRLRNRANLSEDEFQRKICEAIRIKLTSNQKMFDLLKSTNLPLVHYYVYGANPDNLLIVPCNESWVIEFIEEIKNEQSSTHSIA